MLEDSGAQTVAGWATNISPGPADEASQTLTMTTVAANPTLFSVQPDVNATTGNLTFTPASNQFGSTIVTVTLQDSGGTANGGSDTRVQTFNLTINAVNDAPSFAKGADQRVSVTTTLQTVAGWATAVSTGPANEASQALTFTLQTSNNGLFATLPAIDPWTGDLIYAPLTGQWGSAAVTVTLRDNGGTANGGVDVSAPQTFTITVNPLRVYLPLTMRQR